MPFASGAAAGGVRMSNIVTRIEFHVEQMPQADDEPPRYKATEADNFVTWGYGSTVWAAIADLCQMLHDMDDEDSNV